MKRLSALILLWLAAAVAFGADVTFNLADFTTSTITNRQLQILPQSTPRTNAVDLILSSDRKVYTTDSTGSVTVTNMAYGNYLVTLLGPFAKTEFRILVPDVAMATNAVNLLVTTNSVPSESAGYTQSGADARFINVRNDWGSNIVFTNLVLRGSTNAFEHTNGATAGYFLTTDGTRSYWTTAPGGSGVASNAIANLNGIGTNTTIRGWLYVDSSAAFTNQGPIYYEFPPSFGGGEHYNLVLQSDGLITSGYSQASLVNTNAKIRQGTNFIAAVADVVTPASDDQIPILDVSTAERKYVTVGSLPLAGFTNINEGNILYVRTNGLASGTRGRADLAWNSLTNAKDAAVYGDLIVVGPGTWNERLLLKSGVNWYFNGSSVTNYDTNGNLGGWAIFDDRTVGAVTSSIAGSGKFYMSISDMTTNAGGVLMTTNPLTRITLFADQLKGNALAVSENVGFSLVSSHDGTNAVFVKELVDEYPEGLIYDVEESPLSSGVNAIYWGRGDLIVHSPKIVVGGYAYYGSEPVSGATNNCWVEADEIKTFFGAPVYQIGQPNAKTGYAAWIRAKEIRKNGGAGYGAVSAYGGKLYVDAEKISVTNHIQPVVLTSDDALGQTWITSQKISSNYRWVQANAGTLWIDCLHYEDLGGVKDGFFLNGATATNYIQGGQATVAAGRVINHQAGVTVVNGIRAVGLSATATNTPVYVGASGLTLDGGSYIGGAGVASIYVPGTGAQTLSVNGAVTASMLASSNVTYVGATNIFNQIILPNATASRALVVGAGGQVTTATGTPDGTKFLKDDGTYAVPPGGSAAPGGTDTMVQFNQSGTLFAGTNRFTFNRTLAEVTLAETNTASFRVLNLTNLRTNKYNADNIIGYGGGSTFSIYPDIDFGVEPASVIFHPTGLYPSGPDLFDLGIEGNEWKTYWGQNANFSGTVTGAVITVGSTNIIAALAGKQAASMVLSNIAGLSSTVFTNVPLGGTNISVRTTGGTNFIDTTGNLNHWGGVSTNDVWLNRDNALVMLDGTLRGTNQVWTSNLVANLTVNLDLIREGIPYTLIVSNPATYSVTFGLAANDWPEHPDTAPTATTNGWSIFTFLRSGTKTNGWMRGRQLELVAGTGIAFHTNQTGIIVSNTVSAASGEANTASNLGGGVGLWSDKSGVDLRFNSMDETQFGTNGNRAFIKSGAVVTNLSSRGVTIPTITASRALRVNASGNITNAATTETELDYLNGVTSAIQTQLNAKQNHEGSQVLSNLVGTVSNNVTNETSTALQINSGTLSLTPGVLSNIVSSSIDVPVANVVSNVGNIKYLVQQPAITVSNLVVSFATNRYELVGLTNLVMTNIVKEATGVSADLSITVRNINSVNTAIVWPAYGAQHGYFFRTNANNPILSWSAVTNGTTAVISLTAVGTNVFATITGWP